MSQYRLQEDLTFVTLVSAGRVVNASTFASLAFLLYDHALTFEAEVRLVWGQIRWSFGNVLFILNRYFGLFTLIFNIIVFITPSVSLKFCDVFHWWETTSEAIAVLTVEIILMTRIYAVYERSKKLLVMFGLIFVAEVAGTLAVVDGGLPQGIPRPFGIKAGCFTTRHPSLYFLTWIPALICESILCFLMLYKAWTMYKNNYQSSLLRMIIRDSVFYFSTIFATLLLNCLVWAFASEDYLELGTSWAVALPCALGSRLLLNMRERMSRTRVSQPVSGFQETLDTFRVVSLKPASTTDNPV